MSKLMSILAVMLNGTKGSASGSLLAEFELKLPSTTTYNLRLAIPEPNGDILDIHETLTFTSVPGGLFSVSSPSHPRLTIIGAAGGTSTGDKTVWTLQLDPSFLHVTTRAKNNNGSFKSLRQTIANVSGGPDFKLYSDPRSAQSSPVLYRVLDSVTLNAETVNVMVYFQNEVGDSEFIDSHDCGQLFGKLHTPTKQGRYADVAANDWAEYPVAGWPGQIAAANASLLFVAPNVRPSSTLATDFTDFGESPAIGIARLKMLLFARWADDPARGTHPPKLGTVMVSGWSSGMNTVFNWFHTDTDARINVMVCFDGCALRRRQTRKQRAQKIPRRRRMDEMGEGWGREGAEAPCGVPDRGVQ